MPRPWHGRRVDVEGHRGARGLVVESTIPSFLAAFEAGVTGVELDVRLTADGHVVVWHDVTLQPDKCVATREDLVGLRVDDLTLEQLRTVDVGTLTLAEFPGQQAAPGARIATLGELLEASAAAAPDVWWTIEVKVDPTDPREVATRERLVDGVLADIHAAGIERRCFVHSFDWAVLELAEQREPAVLRSALAVDGITYAPGSPWTGSLRWDDHGPDLCAAVAALGAHVVSPYHVGLDAAFVRRAHANGLGVLPWTVNEVDDLRAVIEMGVDGIVTDYPDRAVALLERRG
jgi:glycerophosphoryl diester phosphodiesterase